MTQRMTMPICWWCKHFNVADNRKDPLIRRCTAFPKEIPTEILTSAYDHRYAFPNDQGIQFEVNDNENEIVQWVKRSPIKPYRLLEIMLYGLEEARRNEIDNPVSGEEQHRESFMDIYIRELKKANEMKEDNL